LAERTPYDEVPYASHAYAATHPDRMAMMARLFGLETPDIRTARVLEVGSAAGGNLIPLAMQFPDARFVGVDLSRVEIEEGQEHIRKLGLDNIELHAADILQIGDRFGTFDYSICHGVYSWVPRPVQDEILRLNRHQVVANGASYVSYNCLPGWHMRGLVREMMLFHASGFDKPTDKTAQARALLDFLANAAPDGEDPFSILLRNEASFLGRMSDYYLFHEHLSADNHPLYLWQFLERADDAGLQFLGEAYLQTMMPDQFPPEVKKILDTIGGDIVRLEQYMDFIRNRMFRQTLLVRKEHELERTIGWKQAFPFHFATAAVLPKDADLMGDAALEFSVEGQTVVTANPVLKVAFAVLADAWPSTMPFDGIVEAVKARVGGSTESLQETLGGNLLRCVASSVVEAWTIPIEAAPRREKPIVTPLVRFQVDNELMRLTNLRHQTADVSPLVRRAVSLLDGTRDRQGLIDGLVDEVFAGRLSAEKDGEAVTDRPVLVDAMEGVVDDILDTLYRQSFLV
jgi:methyltransferase-like protein